MKGVICAGGLGTRLKPLTDVTNKHLLPIYNKPMVFYPIETLINAGIQDIIVVTGGQYAGDFFRVLKNGHQLDIKNLNYAYQEGEGGISAAIACAETHAKGDDIAVILGDNYFEDDITQHIKEYKDGAKVFLKEVPDPERFGVPAFENEKITAIYEKPTIPPSKYAITGLYLFDNTVFDRIKTLKPSARGELEVTDLNNSYLKEGKLSHSKLEKYWRDMGTIETMQEVSNRIAETHKKYQS
jgi:glucose-1-phosphate thymidylyltransferase